MYVKDERKENSKEVVMELFVSDYVRMIISILYGFMCGFYLIDKFIFVISINDDIVSSCVKFWFIERYFFSSFLYL